YGGYLPVIAELSPDNLFFDKENIIAVLADNSDDPAYPPGKPQSLLDFCYFGGIYRDVWMVATNPVFITDANEEHIEAGGGVFIHTDSVSKKYAGVRIETAIRNTLPAAKKIILAVALKDTNDNIVAQTEQRQTLSPSSLHTVSLRLPVKDPKLWHPDHPYLYKVYFSVKNQGGKQLDGFYCRTGLRKIEFKGKDGLYINNEPLPDKLIGGNRHQDFAYLGNAAPNNLQWRDAKKLRDAGMRVIRAAHYPQDPAFMDACDELGLFVIVATPGWQFWNKDPLFEKRVYDDIRNMVRRDRNHASVFMWEPILNETHYPDYFAKNVYDIVHKEYPYPGCYAACDMNNSGYEVFDVLYAHPLPENLAKTDKSIFTREWGDNVDDWNAHNSSSRAALSWGEVPQLIQAKHYANPDYPFTSYETLYKAPRQVVGGCLWHPFDNQRGYHPDPFYGGILDAFRQPKYSYEMFKSQRNPETVIQDVEHGYTLFIANEMTPFSPGDVTVYTNCDSVRLIVFQKDTLVQVRDRNRTGMPAPPMVFKNVYDFMQLKSLFRAGKWQQAKLVAEGFAGGKKVITTIKMPAERPEKIVLKLDNCDRPVYANGSDIVVAIAGIADKEGNIKRLNNEHIFFEVSGEGVLVGNEKINANPRAVEWGTAPVLVRTTNKPGRITIKARISTAGLYAPQMAEISFTTMAPPHKMLYEESPSGNSSDTASGLHRPRENNVDLKMKEELLKRVESDQEIFENKKKN
ncbi:MAG: hypothetical protein J7539_18800, partial [Niabella sp.]|nr:hypothetical protein [Niabella sp.]